MADMNQAFIWKYRYQSMFTTKSTSLVNEFAEQLEKSFRELQIPFDEPLIERIAVFLVRAMGTEVRDYHKPEHSLDVSRVDRPITRIAGLFHDVIYLQIDSTWKEFCAAHMDPFRPSEVYSLDIAGPLAQSKDPMLDAITTLFGFQNENHLLLAQGVNEFLSAIVFYRVLGPYLKPLDILKVVACIEATIPFRKIGNTDNASLKLKVRFDEATATAGIPPISESELDEMIVDIQKIVEKDLASFASQDLSHYLANTWSVIFENNPRLKNEYYMVSDYRKALYGVNRFLQGLDPRHMYWVRTSEIEERTEYNLRVGLIYLKMFSISLSLLEAIASCTGGDAPYETMAGARKKAREHNPLTLEALLPLTDEIHSDPEVRQVYEILLNGRGMRSRFDQKGSPLAAFLLHTLGIEKSLLLYDLAINYHENQLTSTQYLRAFPPEVLRPLLESLEHTIKTREKPLRELKAELLEPRKIAARR